MKNTGKIPANVGFSMSPQGKPSCEERKARFKQLRNTQGHVKIVDGYPVPLEN
jgi:hypothetical protein